MPKHWTAHTELCPSPKPAHRAGQAPLLLLLVLLLGAVGCGASSSGTTAGSTTTLSQTLPVSSVRAAISQAGASWTAEDNPNTLGMSLEDLDAMSALIPEEQPSSALRSAAALAAGELPKKFSWRDQGGSDWMTPVKFQGPFGTCTAFATIGTLEAMIRISSNNATREIDLSEWHAFFKAGGDRKIGSTVSKLVALVQSDGTVDEIFCQYRIIPNHDDATCLTQPHIKIASSRYVSGATAMKQALISGPLVGGLQSYQDFHYYKSGIYEHVAGQQRALHAIVLIGYDDEAGCWIGKNSWGPWWGEQGFFRIKYGQCDLEKFGAYAISLNASPSRPSIVSPSNLATDVPLNPQLVASEYSDPERDAHASTIWEVYDAATAGASGLVWSKHAVGGDLTAISVDASNGTFVNALAGKTSLVHGNKYTIRVKYIDAKSNESQFSGNSTFTTVQAPNAPPSTPSITGPIDGAIRVFANPTTASSSFSDADGDRHGSSTWEIYDNASLQAGNLVWSKAGDKTNLTRITVNSSSGAFSGSLSGADRLGDGLSYWVRVKYIDVRGASSAFSKASKFTTEVSTNAAPLRPLITSPTANATNNSQNPTLVASTFSDPDGDTHSSSTWEIYDDASAGSGNRVWSKGNDTSNKTSIIVNAANGAFANALSGQTQLSAATAYWARVQFKDSRGASSPFSPLVKFWTAPSAWARTIGGTGTDVIQAIDRTTDGGYIAAGFTTSGAGGNDFWALRLKPDGNVLWQKAYGGTGEEIARAVKATTDGGFLVAGSTTSFGAGGSDVWLVKLNSDGSVAWQKTYGTTSDEGVIAVGIEVLPDGGFVIASHTSDDAWLFKLTSNAAIVWQKTFGGSGQDIGRGVTSLAGGGFIVAASTTSFTVGAADLWLLRLDDGGTVVWQKSMGGSATDGIFAAIRETGDGGYIVPAFTSSFGPGTGASNFWPIKLSGSGTPVWQQVIGGTGTDTPSQVHVTADGRYLITGHTASAGAGQEDFWRLVLNADGSIADQRAYGGTGSDISRGSMFADDGGLVLAGQSSSFSSSVDAWLVKVNEDGSIPGLGVATSFSATATSASPTDTTAAEGITSVVPATSACTVTNTTATTAQQAP